LRYCRFIRHDLIGLIRADEWWEYKLVPILSAFYATALVLHVAVSSLWVSALSLLLAIVAAAIYASVINDVTDLDGDLEAETEWRGRPLPLDGRDARRAHRWRGFPLRLALAR
jgi:4-hydroxybenzoate polyprenyltransferase